MGKVIGGMNVSLDGYIETTDHSSGGFHSPIASRRAVRSAGIVAAVRIHHVRDQSGEVCLNLVADAARAAGQSRDESAEYRSALGVAGDVMPEAGLVVGRALPRERSLGLP